MLHELSTNEVADFKLRHCDENLLIAQLLRDQFTGWIVPPLIDVGCGVGDISKAAFPDMDVVLLDRLDFSSFDAAHRHQRLLADFFDYKTEEQAQPRTALFSHVLQYIDADRDRLFTKVRDLAFPRIITVLNRNDGIMAELLAWADIAVPDANPELHMPGFPPGYAPEKQCEFTASLLCTDFHVLARQVSYLLDATLSKEQHLELVHFLAERLNTPRLPIAQEITGYRRI